MSWFGWRLWFWEVSQLRHRAKLWRLWFPMTSLLGEVEYDRRTVNQWSVASTNICLLPHSLDEAWRCKFPTHQLLPQPCVNFLITNLSEDVSKHVSCWNWMNGNDSILHFVAEMMMLGVDMSRSWAHLGILDTVSQFDGATVVFEDTTMEMRCCWF